jgi:hypothetical protein
VTAEEVELVATGFSTGATEVVPVPERVTVVGICLDNVFVVCTGVGVAIGVAEIGCNGSSGGGVRGELDARPVVGGMTAAGRRVETGEVISFLTEMFSFLTTLPGRIFLWASRRCRAEFQLLVTLVETEGDAVEGVLSMSSLVSCTGVDSDGFVVPAPPADKARSPDDDSLDSGRRWLDPDPDATGCAGSAPNGTGTVESRETLFVDIMGFDLREVPGLLIGDGSSDPIDVPPS